MSPAALALYLSEQLRKLRGQLATLEQLADELVISQQTSNEATAESVTVGVK